MKDDFLKYLYIDNNFRVRRKRNLSVDIEKVKYQESKVNVEKILIEKYKNNQYPIIFIVGVPRSGTTLLSQLLVNYFEVGFIDNQTSQFFITPLFGLKNREINDSRKYSSLSSNLGITSENYAPHEFGYFWQFYFRHTKHDELNSEELSRIDWNGLNNHLKALAGYNEKPMIFKNPVFFDFKIRYILEHIDNSFIINIVRDPIYVLQSIYNARLSIYKNPNFWWSIKPRDYQAWVKMRPVSQIFNQITYVSDQIDRQTINSNRILNLSYERLVLNPNRELELVEKILEKKEKIEGVALGSNQKKLNDRLFNEIVSKF